ncbi:MAG: hypothetical protein ACYCV7_12525 [Acidimicrobiales bacterium]
MNVGGIESTIADERTMLAMKIKARRGARGVVRDIEFLLDDCGIDSDQGAVELYEEYFSNDPMPERSPRRIQGALDALARQNSSAASRSVSNAVQGRHRDGRFAAK